LAIYTKNGDDGRSSTIKGYPANKDANIFQILGAIDELSANLGVAKFESRGAPADAIRLLQAELSEVAGFVAGGAAFDFAAQTSNLELLIDSFEKKMSRGPGFTMSGETRLGALLDVSRTVARRLERSVVTSTKNFGLTKAANPYFNRLSDLLYILARYADTLAAAVEPAARLISDTLPSGVLNMQVAVRLCQDVLERARGQGIQAVCAVCGVEGNLLALLRDDGAFIASVDIAKNKAWTAAALQMSTADAMKLSEDKDKLYGLQYINDERLVLLAGGEPLRLNGGIAGAIGVSGGMAWQDGDLAFWGKELFEKDRK